MNKCFIIILYVVEGSEKLFTFCMVSIFRKRFRTEWFGKFVFNFNLTGVQYFPFGFEDRIWDLIVSVPDHCLSFYFKYCVYCSYMGQIHCFLILCFVKQMFIYLDPILIYISL